MTAIDATLQSRERPPPFAIGEGAVQARAARAA
jgi:hypothetical protein